VKNKLKKNILIAGVIGLIVGIISDILFIFSFNILGENGSLFEIFYGILSYIFIVIPLFLSRQICVKQGDLTVGCWSGLTVVMSLIVYVILFILIYYVYYEIKNRKSYVEAIKRKRYTKLIINIITVLLLFFILFPIVSYNYQDEPDYPDEKLKANCNNYCFEQGGVDSHVYYLRQHEFFTCICYNDTSKLDAHKIDRICITKQFDIRIRDCNLTN